MTPIPRTHQAILYTLSEATDGLNESSKTQEIYIPILSNKNYNIYYNITNKDLFATNARGQNLFSKTFRETQSLAPSSIYCIKSRDEKIQLSHETILELADIFRLKTEAYKKEHTLSININHSNKRARILSLDDDDESSEYTEIVKRTRVLSIDENSHLPTWDVLVNRFSTLSSPSEEEQAINSPITTSEEEYNFLLSSDSPFDTLI